MSRSNLDAPPEDTTVYLVTDRRTVISPYARGNPKLGAGVYTYDRTAVETCPGATSYCVSVCYAKRISDNPVVRPLLVANEREEVPPVPADAKLVRWHVSGDFDTAAYIHNWTDEVRRRPDVTFWGYTRTWRLPALGVVGALRILRDEPNVQLFASTDPDTSAAVRATLHEKGWRLADIAPTEPATRSGVADHGGAYFVCPEETGHKRNCEECRYCFDGKRGDVVFVEH